MNIWIKTVFEWAQTKGKQIPIQLKEVVDKLKNQPSISVSDLANMIKLHPDTEIKRDEWLGLLFHFYKLQVGNVTFYLETKGKDKSYIILCQVSDEGGIVSEYRSYEEGMSVNNRMKVPLVEKF